MPINTAPHLLPSCCGSFVPLLGSRHHPSPTPHASTSTVPQSQNLRTISGSCFVPDLYCGAASGKVGYPCETPGSLRSCISSRLRLLTALLVHDLVTTTQHLLSTTSSPLRELRQSRPALDHLHSVDPKFNQSSSPISGLPRSATDFYFFFFLFWLPTLAQCAAWFVPP